MKNRREELQDIVKHIGDEKKAVIEPLIEDIVYMEDELEKLRQLPRIRVHPKSPERQMITPAGKLYKETQQSYTAAIKIIMTALYKTDSSAADELLEKLKAFEI